MHIVLFLVLFGTMATAMFALLAATLAPSSVIGARLRTLVGPREEQRKPRLEERFEQQVLDPLANALPKSPTEVSRTRAMLMMAGYREPKHMTYYFGLRVLN